jgi:hypothetical protein
MKYFYMRMNSIPQGKEILLYCHPTWLPSRDHAKPLFLNLVDEGRVEQQCDWIGKLRNLTQHRETCPFKQVQCPNAKCTEMIQRKEIEEHVKVCEFKMMVCEECRIHLVRRELAKHEKYDCPETLIPCPNKCLNRQGLIKKIKR